MSKLTPRVRILVSLVLTVFALVLILACSDGPTAVTTDGTTPTSAPKATAATSPTPTRTPTPTPVPKKGLNAAVAGGTVSAFTAKYGKPISTQDSGNGTATISYKGTGKIGRLAIHIYTDTKIVFAVQVGPPSIWDAETGLLICLAFAPEDAVMGDTQHLHDKLGNPEGIYQKAFSDELGKSVPANLFVDLQQNHVKPGTLGLGYYYFDGEDTLLQMCVVNLGYEPIEI